jgi:hypothetical protein
MYLKALTTAILDVIFAIAFVAYKVIQCCLIEHFVVFSYGPIFIDGVLKFFHETGLLPGPTSKYYICFFERSIVNGFAATILDVAISNKSQNQDQSDCYYTPRIPYIPQIFFRWLCYRCALNCKNVTIFCYPGRIPWWSYLRCQELPVLVNLNTKVVRIDFRGVSGDLIAVWERGSDSKWFISWQHDIANTQACMDTSYLFRDVQGRKPLPLFTSGWLDTRVRGVGAWMGRKRREGKGCDLSYYRGYLDPEAMPPGQRPPWNSSSDEDAMTEAFNDSRSPGAKQ